MTDCSGNGVVGDADPYMYAFGALLTKFQFVILRNGLHPGKVKSVSVTRQKREPQYLTKLRYCGNDCLHQHREIERLRWKRGVLCGVCGRPMAAPTMDWQGQSLSARAEPLPYDFSVRQTRAFS